MLDDLTPGSSRAALRREQLGQGTRTASPRIHQPVAQARPGHSDAPHYRPDIDGLRAVAVLSVVAFHLGVPGIRGGFIGVDIFFVISGYLITGIITREIASGTFSLADFYVRRIRRILPALLLVLGVVTGFAVFLLFPGELVDYANSLVAALFFVSNLYFLSKAQYFGGAADSMPLLHTWSLAIEEQFYLFFPLGLMLVARLPWLWARLRFVIAAVALASFAASVVLVAVHQELAFYLLVSRAWELCAGALLATGFVPAIRHRLLAELLGLAGLAVIIAAVLLYHRAIHFPGLLAAPPVVAAVAIIHAGSLPGTIASRLLGARAPVLIGKISYSLYLWHWPLIVFWHLGSGRQPDLPAMAGIFVASLALSYLSWRFVETPFRRSTSPVARHPWAAAGLSALLVLGFAWPCWSAGGWPSRFTPEQNQTAAYLAYDDRDIYRRGTCFIDSHVQAAADFDAGRCLTPVEGKPNILILGDSHAAHLWRAMAESLPDANVLQATASGCKPLIGGAGERACIGVMNEALLNTRLLDRLDTIVLSARWQPDDLPLLRATVADLARPGLRIYVFGPIETYETSLPRLLAQAETRGSGVVEAARLPDADTTDRLFAAALHDGPARYVSLVDLLCPGGDSCLSRTADGTPLQWDYGHLTLPGARTVLSLAAQKGQFP